MSLILTYFNIVSESVERQSLTVFYPVDSLSSGNKII